MNNYADISQIKEHENTGNFSVFVTVIVRITLKDGCYHEDVGGGSALNQKGKGAAIEKVFFT
jgi:DNA repair and recombination protein RAD52